MLSLRKPSVESIRLFRKEQAKQPFSYSAVGATATTPPAGFVVDHTRIKLGEGESAFNSCRLRITSFGSNPTSTDKGNCLRC